MNGAKHRWCKNDVWLFVGTWFVRRHLYASGFLAAVGIALSLGEMVLRSTAFMATRGAPIGVTPILIGFAGLLLAGLTAVLLIVLDWFDGYEPF
jgi:hypothetical protein